MDRTLATLTALLLDPFLTSGEAEREAAATRHATEPSTLRRAPRTVRLAEKETNPWPSGLEL
ncbi:MAG: hypothetical protein C0467_00175 [Planctomycetaceae bacterium]|nr:hypothetical protein [Planctomycetaceae bacterium]